jgi:hypothetical protein
MIYINTATITTPMAQVNGGFIYQVNVNDYILDLRSLTVTSSSVTTGSGGFGYINALISGQLKSSPQHLLQQLQH